MFAIILVGVVCAFVGLLVGNFIASRKHDRMQREHDAEIMEVVNFFHKKERNKEKPTSQYPLKEAYSEPINAAPVVTGKLVVEKDGNNWWQSDDFPLYDAKPIQDNDPDDLRDVNI